MLSLRRTLPHGRRQDGDGESAERGAVRADGEHDWGQSERAGGGQDERGGGQRRAVEEALVEGGRKINCGRCQLVGQGRAGKAATAIWQCIEQ